jgi:hypothetical protein
MRCSVCSASRGQGADVAARSAAAVADLEQAAQLVEREADGKGAADQAHAIHGRGRVTPVAGMGPRRPGQDADALVVAERIGADAGQSGQFAGQEMSAVSSHLTAVAPWNRFQGQ